MQSTGSNLPEKPEIGLPLWLLAELTYRCPLQCPYCSNPLDFAEQGKELSTEQWIKVFREAREMGAAQLGFSGGEPLVRQDLAELIAEARKLGFYTNLITSGIGLTEQKISDFKKAGLDHIQISFQASDEQVNNLLAGSKKAFAQKLEMARAVKAHGYPMVLNLCATTACNTSGTTRLASTAFVAMTGCPSHAARATKRKRTLAAAAARRSCSQGMPAMLTRCAVNPPITASSSMPGSKPSTLRRPSSNWLFAMSETPG